MSGGRGVSPLAAGGPGANDTGSFTYFPHLKKSLPLDQTTKLTAMHRAGKANAGIYIGVVLVVYAILLTILLCRYARRQRSATTTSAADSSPPTRTTLFLSYCPSLPSCLKGRGGGGGARSSHSPHRGSLSGGGAVERIEISVERVPLNTLISSASSPTQL